MQDLEDFLNTELAKLPEFQARHESHGRHLTDKQAAIMPDASGCIYEVCGLCGVILDCVSNISDAEKLASDAARAWSFYQIWQIYVGDGKRILISQKEIRRPGTNPLGQAALFKNIKDSQKGSA